MLLRGRRKYVCQHALQQVRWYTAKRWEDMGLHPALIQRLHDLNFSEPTSIQSRAIPHIIRGASTICHAETGCGKTFCYLIPLIHQLLVERDLSSQYVEGDTLPQHVQKDPIKDEEKGSILRGYDSAGVRLERQRSISQYLILAPSHELSLQIKSMFESIRPLELGMMSGHIWEGLKFGRSHIDTTSPLIITTFSKIKNYDYYKIFGHIPTIVLDEADVYHTESLKNVTFRTLVTCPSKVVTTVPEIVDKPTKLPGELVDPLRYRRVLSGQLPKRKQLLYVAATLNDKQSTGSGNNLKHWLRYHNIDHIYAKSDRTHMMPSSLETIWRYVDTADVTTEILDLIESVYCEEQTAVEEIVPDGYEDLHEESFSPDDSIPIFVPEDRQVSDRDVVNPDAKMLIFMNNANVVDVLYKTIINYLKSSPSHSLSHLSRYVYRLSGSISKEEREAVLKRIGRGRIRILIASDLASRGIDIPDLDMVVNAQLPVDSTGYIHRAGRTARMGRSGTVVNFLSPNDVTLYKTVSGILKRKLPRFDDTFKNPPQSAEEKHRKSRTPSEPWLVESRPKFVSKIYRHDFEIS